MLPGPLRVSSPFPFVGRERELIILRSLLRLTEDGESGQAAVVGGEAGSGKTRLVRDSPAMQQTAERSCSTEARTPWSTLPTSRS